jgi:tetratricopeptide (TPR) repeat protein
LKNAAIAAGNLSEVYLTIGDLSHALKFAQQSVELADQSSVERQRMIKRSLLADVLHQAGRLEEAAATFQEAEAVQKQWQPESLLLSSYPGFLYCDLLLEMGQVQEVKERATQSLEITTRNQWLLVIALDSLSLARAAFFEAQQKGAHDISEAAEFMRRAIDGLQQAGMTSFFPRGLLARAALHRYTGNYERAKRDLAEVLRLAIRGSMGLYLVDYHLESARLRLAQGDLKKAREHLASAREMIKRMGYHQRDNEVSELAEKLR